MGSRRRCGERGAAAMELVLVTPMLIILLLFLAFVGRISGVKGDVQSAARDGARAAALERSAGAAQAAGDAATQEALKQSGVKCESFGSTVDTSRFRPGGSVTVTVECSIRLSDLGLLINSSRSVRSTATEVIDVFRGGS